MLLEPIGAGVRRFTSEVLHPRYATRLPRTMAALRELLDDDDSDANRSNGDANRSDGDNYDARSDAPSLAPSLAPSMAPS
eukprot:221539-Prorocentrum_minimum.AAC.1